MSFFIILIAFVFVLIPSFAVISSSQSNNSLSNTSLSNASISEESDDDTPFFENETSFASLSRSLAETNQSEDEEATPPPPSGSEDEEPIAPPPPPGSEDEADGEEAND